MDVQKLSLVGLCAVVLCCTCFASELPEVDFGPNAALEQTASADSDSGVSGDVDTVTSDSAESGQLVEYVPVTDEPLAVIVQEDAAPLSVSGSGYTGMLSSQYVEYFAGIASKFWGKDYVLYRADQSHYTLVYDAELTLSGTSFVGTGKSVTYYTGQYNDSASLIFMGEDAVNLTLAGVSAYSNLGDFPELEGVNRLEKIACVVVCVCACTAFACSLLFGRVRR